MPYTLPTFTTFKERFAEFAAVADARVSAVIGEAARFVDESWLENDYTPAINFLTAHMLVLEGVLNPTPVPTGVSSGQVTAYSLGDADVSFAGPANGVGDDTGGLNLFATPYGRRFMALLINNQGGAVIV